MKWYDPDASPAATAPNWWQVVLVDLVLGVAAVVAGLVLSFTWSRLWGAALATLGVLYVFAVIRRGQGWKARRDAEQAGDAR